ncbi:Lrp/AsnC family transcriptional regulator [Variovorax sp. J22R133]|uniref:Lrp/AsnC family transcriptional regulator n=1 Tax=Variovorax brevis TaxID=3053503 RepID=UPI002577BFF5|nr:Lrp/AsnC family transcriptional regulator [Variovorax sp. J22R133]MDM0113319.1 Lrp/AsnC family transcriptional regulator [Variovorax sp. J22R133]
MELQLDDLDRHLLTLLQANARESAANLARKLKIARTTVVARIARLEREGIVAGYGVRLGQPMEQAAVRAFCSVSVDARRASAVIAALERLPEVEAAWAVSGAFDYVIHLRCETPEQLDKLLDRLGQIEGVHQTQTSIVLSRKIDRRMLAPSLTDSGDGRLAPSPSGRGLG